MRIGTLRAAGGRRTVALRDGELVELEGSVEALLLGGREAIERAVENARHSVDFQPERLGPAVANPGKFLCIGKNYADHAAELGGKPPPATPEVFMRSRTSLCGPYDAVRRPAESRMLDFEAELAVVIGKPGRRISEAEAMGHVAGYCVFNDLSIRDYQNFGSQWTPGKNFDGLGPLGPFLVTADEIEDPFQLDIECVVQGPGGEERMQHSNTRLMVHSIPRIIAFISLWTTLEPGDVIATGTPGGVGFGRKPYRFLEPGETVVTRVAGVGELKNKVLEDGEAEP